MKRGILAVLALMLLPWTSCDNATETETPMTVRVTNPSDSSLVSVDTTIRVLTEVTSPCGCSMHAQFFINGQHKYSDYVPYYTYDWTPSDTGWHSIAVRAVKDDFSVEAWDSVRVHVQRSVDIDTIPR